MATARVASVGTQRGGCRDTGRIFGPEAGLSGQVPMQRRQFLQATGVLTGLVAAGTPLAMLVPARAWAIDLKRLTSEEARTLLAVTRTIAPHDGLDDSAYALVVRSADEDASQDAVTLELLRSGLKGLGPQFSLAK